MKTIHSDKAPEAIGPYSHAVKIGSIAYLSGQIPLNPETMQLASDNIKGQTEQVIDNIKSVLSSLECGLENVAKTTVFLKSMSDFPEMNQTYERMFGNCKPARSTIEVARLPMDALVEIECIVEVN